MADTQTFEATPTLVGNNVKWKLCYTSPEPDECGENNGTYPDVILGANKGHYDFQYTIVNDQTGKGITFATNDPVAIKKGDGGQIDNVTGNGTTVLKFRDKNDKPNKDFPDPVVIDYQLNFTDKDGNEVTAIDPDITNGGTNTYYQPPGGGPGLVDPGSSAFWMLMGSIFLVSLAATLAARLIKFGR